MISGLSFGLLCNKAFITQALRVSFFLIQIYVTSVLNNWTKNSILAIVIPEYINSYGNTEVYLENSQNLLALRILWFVWLLKTTRCLCRSITVLSFFSKTVIKTIKGLKINERLPRMFVTRCMKNQKALLSPYFFMNSMYTCCILFHFGDILFFRP